jgi:hypothetical protein
MAIEKTYASVSGSGQLVTHFSRILFVAILSQEETTTKVDGRQLLSLSQKAAEGNLVRLFLNTNVSPGIDPGLMSSSPVLK